MKNKKLNKVNQGNQVDARFTHGEAIRADLRRSKLWKVVLACITFITLAVSTVLGFVGLSGKSPLNDSSIDPSNDIAYAEDNIYFKNFSYNKYSVAQTYVETSYASAWRQAVTTSSEGNPKTFTLTSDWVATPVAAEENSLAYSTSAYTNLYRTEFGRDWFVESTTGYKVFVNSLDSATVNSYGGAFVDSYSFYSNYTTMSSNYSGALFVPKGKSVIIN
ncbi:MAG: hypothetical protein ACI4MB_05430, partial [Candidatus Coproplasma sp.]